MRFIVLLVVAAALALLDALAVRAGMRQSIGIVLLLGVLGASVAVIMRTPAWGRSIARSRGQSRY